MAARLSLRSRRRPLPRSGGCWDYRARPAELGVGVAGMGVQADSLAKSVDGEHAAHRHRAGVWAVLAVFDGQGSIGREMLAIDGVKVPSNASNHRSGTRAECTQRAKELLRPIVGARHAPHERDGAHGRCRAWVPTPR